MTDDCPAAAPEPASSPLSLTLSQWWCVLKGMAATADERNAVLVAYGRIPIGTLIEQIRAVLTADGALPAAAREAIAAHIAGTLKTTQQAKEPHL